MAHEASQLASRVDVVRALRQATITGLIAFGLFLPLIGFNTVQNIRNELVLETRWPLLATMVAIIAGGRFIYSLLIAPWLAERAMRPRPETVEPAAWRTAVSRVMLPFGVGFAIIYPVLTLALVG